MRGGTADAISCVVTEELFQSTRPVRGGTISARSCTAAQSDFNPPAPCGAGLRKQFAKHRLSFISIHPPRAGRDVPETDYMAVLANFNPPAPCGAGRLAGSRNRVLYPRFQSTRPVRGGTSIKHIVIRLDNVFQSTRPVRGGTSDCRQCLLNLFGFQSTRPVRGGTADGDDRQAKRTTFQSTRPVRGGTEKEKFDFVFIVISIHPPRAGRDVVDKPSGATLGAISIHPPRAGRDCRAIADSWTI